MKTQEEVVKDLIIEIFSKMELPGNLSSTSKETSYFHQQIRQLEHLLEVLLTAPISISVGQIEESLASRFFNVGVCSKINALNTRYEKKYWRLAEVGYAIEYFDVKKENSPYQYDRQRIRLSQMLIKDCGWNKTRISGVTSYTHPEKTLISDRP